MAAQFYKINYKSDFVLTINSDAGWAVPFCIKFWTGMPSHGYFAGFDGENYVNCRVGETPTQLLVMFDDHHMQIGPLRMQIAYHTTIEEFPDRKFDEVTNPTNVTVDIDGTEYQVMLDFTGETGAEIDFSMPSSGVMSVNGKIGYVTLNAEDVGAQPTIEDLATIRSGAAEGATAVQPAEMTAALATKQDTIPDLANIRSGAAAGATAVQPATLQEGLATKQDVISDLATIRSGAAAGATAVQPAALQEGLATKQNVISDLATIRSGAAAGATAVQPAALTPIENDIDAIEGKIPSAASTSNQLADKAFVNSALADKADTSDIPTALSQLSQDSTHRVVTDAEKSTWNGKQNAIDDLATIRSGAAAGATAVQPAAINTALAAKQDTLTFDNTPTANSSNPVKSSGIKTALDAKQSTISTVNVTVDNNTGTPSGSASVSGSTLSLSFQNLKGATGATGATGPQGPQGERGLPGESGVTGDVSGFTVIQTIDPSATYGATDIAGAATVQATNAELTELSGEVDDVSGEINGNPLNYSNGVYLESTGVSVALKNSCVTGFIPAIQNDVVIAHHGYTSNPGLPVYLLAYNSSKQFISGQYWALANYSLERTITLTNAQIAYVRMAFNPLATDAFISINGVKNWIYRTASIGLIGERGYSVEKTGAEIQIYNGNYIDWIVGYVRDNSGVQASSSVNHCTGFIDIEGFDTIEVEMNYNTTASNAGVCFYKSDGSYIIGYTPYIRSEKGHEKRTFNVPDDAKYLRASFYDTYLSLWTLKGIKNAQFVEKTALNSIEERIGVLEKGAGFLIGSPKLYLSGETSASVQSLNAKTSADLYAEYDTLATNNPLFFKRKNDLGSVTYEGNSYVIRSYSLGYNTPVLIDHEPTTDEVIDINGSANLWTASLNPRKILLVSGMHGEEHTPCWGMMLAIKEILESTEDWAQFIKYNFIIEIAPCLNPAGWSHLLRTDSQGNIMNRDAAINDPETTYYMDWVDANKDAFILLDNHGTQGRYAYLPVMNRAVTPIADMVNGLANKLGAAFQNNWKEFYNNISSGYGTTYAPYIVAKENPNSQPTRGTCAYRMLQDYGMLAFAMETPDDLITGGINANDLRNCKLTKDIVINVLQAVCRMISIPRRIIE